MIRNESVNILSHLKKKHPRKFAPEDQIFQHLRRGDRIFVGTGCGQPQYLVNSLVDYAASHPKALFDTEVLQVWSLGIAPYLDKKFKKNFRLNSLFIGSAEIECPQRTAVICGVDQGRGGEAPLNYKTCVCTSNENPERSKKS